MILLTLMAVTVIAIVTQRSMFGVVILSGIYSFLMASVLIVYDAVDVAMTEASVGAGVSTVVLLGTLALVKTREAIPHSRNALALCLALVVGGALVWGTLQLPAFGIADAAIHQHVAPHYLRQSVAETNVPNVVTAVLADYRGYDTLGETTVVFTAGIGVMLLLRGAWQRAKDRKRNPRA
jgi:multicomponent Na+:H+ antiporter subunit B